MFYHTVSKILSPLLDPGNFLLFLLVLGALLYMTRWNRTGRALMIGAITGLLVIAVLPLGSWLTTPLENRFQAPPDLQQVDGIIVLGGATQAYLTKIRGQSSLNANAERLTGFVNLARRYPDARLVFTGGSSALKGDTISEADIAEQIFQGLGLDTSRIHFERNARNTWENAQKTYPVIKPSADQTWLLVTSARHMPRAVGVFRKTGWSVTAWPVDYRTSGETAFGLRFNLKAGLAGLSEGIREWVALMVYVFMDRTDNLFPAP